MVASPLSSLRYGECLAILLSSLATASLCELISFVLIYRTPTYRSLLSSINRASRRLDTLRSTRSKKADRVESALRDSSRDLSLCKFKSGAVVAVVLFAAFALLNSLFDGRAVAKLPFSPVPLVRKMSHRGLPGSDPTDCSMPFLYLLCSISIRTNLQKALGFAPPRGSPASPLFPLPDPKAS